ncbi:MAG TPA: hypothetical protein VN903_37455 [Polyangia bacterium]|jgi:hypothetical protein|nr:hypothetical protein [Polyangia bacterium]
MTRLSKVVCLLALGGALSACGGNNSSKDAAANHGGADGGQARGGAGGGGAGGTGGLTGQGGTMIGGTGGTAGTAGTGAVAGTSGTTGTSGGAGTGGAAGARGGAGGSAGTGGTLGTGGTGGSAGSAGRGGVGGSGGSAGTGGAGTGGSAGSAARGGSGGTGGAGGVGGLDGSVDASTDRPADATTDTGAGDRVPDGPDAGPQCQTAAECATNEICLLPAGRCQCPAQFRVCGGVCGPDGPTRCGASCRVCPGTTDGDAVCNAGVCDIACRTNYATCTAGCCRAFGVERVDSPIGGGGDRPIALTFDAAGNPHVAFNDPTNFAVLYATRVGGVWKLEEIDPGPLYAEIDATIAIAVDAAGDVHVAYPGGTYELRYARRTAGMWLREDIEPTGVSVHHVSLAVDASRAVHVTYDSIDYPIFSLRHAWRGAAESAWHYETIDGDANTSVGLYQSLALDAAGNPRVAYTDSTNADLKYAAWDGTGWRIETVERAGNTGAYPSLALDAQGRPRITYYDITNHAIRFAEYAGTTWTLTTAVTIDIADYGLHLALDGTGVPWVAFYGYDRSRPALYRRSGATWVREMFDPLDRDGRRTALATDPSGAVQIAYSTANYDDGLELAHLVGGVGGVWTREVIDNKVDAGYENDIAVDASGRPHIAYLETSNAQVWYATRDAAGAWTRRFVGTAGGDNITVTMGGYPSVAVEPGGRPHIVWYDANADDLLHAVWNGSAWVVDVVDPMPWYQPWPSIAIDAAGQPHIVYAPTSGGLAYAVKTSAGYSVEPAVPSGMQPNLLLDASGTPHFSYYEPGTKATRYAHRTATGWASETVGTADSDYPSSGIAVDGAGTVYVCWTQLVSNYLALGFASRPASGGWIAGGPTFPANTNVGALCSVAVDAQNQPHISHQGGSVLYSHLSGGTWISMSIDPYSYGGATSIAIDPQGSPQISYYQSSYDQLRYARQR